MIVSFIIGFIIVGTLGCHRDWSIGEEKAVEIKCKSICNEMNRKSYSIGSSQNGLGCVFYYLCFCYNAEGRIDPIEIKINKESIKY